MTLWQRIKHRLFGSNYVWVQWGHTGVVQEIFKHPSVVELVHIFGETLLIDGDNVTGHRKIVRLT